MKISGSAKIPSLNLISTLRPVVLQVSKYTVNELLAPYIAYRSTTGRKVLIRFSEGILAEPEIFTLRMKIEQVEFTKCRIFQTTMADNTNSTIEGKRGNGPDYVYSDEHVHYDEFTITVQKSEHYFEIKYTNGEPQMTHSKL